MEYSKEECNKNIELMQEYLRQLAIDEVELKEELHEMYNEVKNMQEYDEGVFGDLCTMAKDSFKILKSNESWTQLVKTNEKIWRNTLERIV